jgi:uncharacterized protein with GYD domain
MISKNKNLVVTICHVSYAHSNIVTLLDGSDRFHKNVQFPAGQVWKEIYFTTGTADFTENQKENDPGYLYDQSLKITFPGEDESKTISLDDLNQPLVILMKLSSGESKVFGSPENPAKLIDTKSIGTKSSLSNLLFSCSSQELAWWIDPLPGGLPD